MSARTVRALGDGDHARGLLPDAFGRSVQRVSAGDKLRALQAVATDIVRNLDFDSTLLSISNAAVELLNADMVGIMGAHENRLKMLACAGNRKITAARFEVHKGEGVAGIVLETGLPRRLDDFHDAAYISDDIKQIAEEEGVRAAIGAPLLANGQVIGAVMAWSGQPAAFDDDDEAVLEGLANLAAIAIQNARLYTTAQDAVANLELANQRLREQYGLLQGATAIQAELTRLVLRGGGLTALVEMVARSTRGPVAVLHPDLDPLTTTGVCEELVGAAGLRLRELRRCARPVEGTDVTPYGTGKGELLLREISAGAEPMAYLCMGVDDMPGELAALVAEQASVVCALELTKERAVLDARTRVRSDFVWDLLEGKIADQAEANVRARYLGHTLPRRLRVIVIDVREPDDAANAPAAADPEGTDRRRASLLTDVDRTASEAGVTHVLSARRGSAIALIVPELAQPTHAKELAARILAALGRRGHGLILSAGVSGCHDRTADLRNAMCQATTALASVSGTTAGVAVFEDLGILRFLLAPGERGDTVEFVQRMLGPLLHYDEQHATELVKTLDAYLNEARNLGRTAARLYIHPKTVRYRLDRIRDLTGRDLSHPQDCFDLQLALHISAALQLQLAKTEPWTATAPVSPA